MALKFEDIKDEFLTRLRRDREATALMASIESGGATYATATQYAARVGEILGQVLKFNAPIKDISDWDIDDLIPGSLGLDHRIVTNACRAVQETMNRDAGIGIRYQEPTFDWDRVHGIVDELRDNPEFINIEETFYDQISNFSQSVVDSSVRANAAVASGAGIKTWVIRTASSKACKWCRAAAGRYNYEDVKGTGDDVWRRHENCNCTIDYVTERNGSTYRERVYGGGEESGREAEWYSQQEEMFSSGDDHGLIQLSRSYFGDDTKLSSYFEQVTPLDGYEDFGFHCDPYSMEFAINGQTTEYSAREFADILRIDPQYHGGDIRLLACNAGAADDGFAQQLADELRVNVLAPTELLFMDESGEMFVSNNELLADMWYNSTREERLRIRQTGDWRLFKPK